MTSNLPPQLLKLFVPRPQPRYLPPVDHSFSEKKRPVISGLAEFLGQCKDHDLGYVGTETREMKRKRIKAERALAAKEKLSTQTLEWEPSKNPDATDDPYNTLFVGRLSYGVSESLLRREFERYGQVKDVKIVYDKETTKPKGYAFVEFTNETDLKRAFKEADGMKIEGKRIVVDVERGRTVTGWKPRRLGGGLGRSRIGAPKQNSTYSGRDQGQRPSSASSYKRRDQGSYRRRSRSPRRDYQRRDYDDRRRDYEKRDYDRRGSGYDRRDHRRDDKRDQYRNDRRDYR